MRSGLESRRVHQQRNRFKQVRGRSPAAAGQLGESSLGSPFGQRTVGSAHVWCWGNENRPLHCGTHCWRDRDDRLTSQCHRGVCRNPTCPDLPSQDTEGGTEHMVFEADCSGTQSQVVPPQKAYVSAQLTRHDPTGAWTGAVAGIVITVQ